MTFTGSEILYAFLFGGIALLGLIFIFRKYLAHQSNRLSSKYEDQDVPNRLKKYPEANILKSNGTFYRVGLMFSIGMAVLALNWTTFEKMVEVELIDLEGYIDMNHTPIVPTPPPPPPPPPPLPVIEEVEDDLVEDDIDLSEMWTDDEPFNLEPIERPSKKIVAPIIIDEPEDEEPIEEPEFTVVEDMPSFPGCEDLPTNTERKACSEQELLKYIYKNIKYPTIARDNGIEGLVVVSFVINKNGKVEKASVLKDIGGSCGEEALRVINTMNNMPQSWTPGRQRSQNVNVRYNMPVRFRLQQ